MTKIVKKLFVIYVILSFLNACATNYHIQQVMPAGEYFHSQAGQYTQIIQNPSFLLKSVYQSYEKRGFEFDWYITNTGQKAIEVDVRNISCSISDDNNIESVAAYDEDNSLTKFSAEENDTSAGNIIAGVIAIILVVGLFYILFKASDDDDSENNHSSRYANKKEKPDVHIHKHNHIHVANNNQVNIIQGNTVNKQNIVVDTPAIAAITQDNTAAESLNIVTYMKRHSIEPSHTIRKLVRCPLTPKANNSRLTISAKINDVQVESVHHILASASSNNTTMNSVETH